MLLFVRGHRAFVTNNTKKNILIHKKREPERWMANMSVCTMTSRLQIESQNPQDPTKLKEIQFDLEDVPASLLQ